MHAREANAAATLSAAFLDLEHDYAANGEGTTLELLDLPPEILLYIISLLDAQSVCRLASTSCFMAQLCSSPRVWRRFLGQTDLACLVKGGSCAGRVRPEEYRQILLHRPKKVFNIFSMISLPQPWMISFCLPCTVQPSSNRKKDTDKKNHKRQSSSAPHLPLQRKGSWLSRKVLFRKAASPPSACVVMCGLEKAGKRSLIHKLRYDLVKDPALQLSMRLFFRVWQLDSTISDPQLLHRFRQHIFWKTQAVVYVVDSSDRAQIAEAREGLWSLINDDTVSDAIFLILANKQDLDESLSAHELSEALGLYSWTTHAWTVIPTCAQCGAGLRDMVHWLQSNLIVRSSFSEKVPRLPGDGLA